MASKVRAEKQDKRELVPDARATQEKKIQLEDTFQSGVSLPARMRDVQQPTMPARYAPTPSAMDRAMALRSQLVDSNGVVPGIGVATFDERTSDWLLDKAALAEKLRYDAAFTQLFDHADHATRDKFLKLYPEYAQKRIDQIRTIASIQVQLAMMHVTGPQTKDDLDLIIGIANAEDRQKLLQTISKPVHKLWEVGDQSAEKAFMRGYFSPLRLTGALDQNPNRAQRGAGWDWLDSQVSDPEQAAAFAQGDRRFGNIGTGTNLSRLLGI